MAQLFLAVVISFASFSLQIKVRSPICDRVSPIHDVSPEWRVIYLETALKTSLMNASLQLEPYKHREDNILKVASHGQSSRFHDVLF